MLKNTLKWRKENKIDSIIVEDFGNVYDTVAYMRRQDCEGHIICDNVYGVPANDEVYNKTIGMERFLRWRFRLMEKQIQKLDFKPNSISTLLQINDLKKKTPGPSRKDLQLATKRALRILQDNYPEFVARSVTVYIGVEEIPVHYGGLRKENDPDFSTKDTASEITVKAGVNETTEIPAPEAGNTLMWDLTIVGWDVNYREEIVPTDEGSCNIIVKKGKKITWQEDSICNSFRNNEPGKVVITIENGIYKKKRVLYRYKTVNTSAAS